MSGEEGMGAGSKAAHGDACAGQGAKISVGIAETDGRDPRRALEPRRAAIACALAGFRFANLQDRRRECRDRLQMAVRLRPSASAIKGNSGARQVEGEAFAEKARRRVGERALGGGKAVGERREPGALMLALVRVFIRAGQMAHHHRDVKRALHGGFDDRQGALVEAEPVHAGLELKRGGRASVRPLQAFAPGGDLGEGGEDGGQARFQAELDHGEIDALEDIDAGLADPRLVEGEAQFGSFRGPGGEEIPAAGLGKGEGDRHGAEAIAIRLDGRARAPCSIEASKRSPVGLKRLSVDRHAGQKAGSIVGFEMVHPGRTLSFCDHS